MTEHKCPCSAAGQAAHCHGWSHGYNALSDQRSIRQIITDSPQQAAAVAESLTEENMNKQLKAQGLPEAKVIQGLSVCIQRRMAYVRPFFVFREEAPELIAESHGRGASSNFAGLKRACQHDSRYHRSSGRWSLSTSCHGCALVETLRCSRRGG